jgi:hypothetical protein
MVKTPRAFGDSVKECAFDGTIVPSAMGDTGSSLVASILFLFAGIAVCVVTLCSYARSIT